MATINLTQDATALLLRHWGKVVITFIVARAIYRRYVHPLRHVPGPWLASITSLWLVGVQMSPRQHWIYVELHRKYGPVVRVSPYRVIFTSPDSLHDYFTWDKSRYWKAFEMHPTVANHGTHLEAKDHRIEKAKIAGAYTLTNILKSEEKVNGHILELLSQLQTKIGVPFDLAPWMQYFGWDVVMDVTMSKLTGFVSAGYDINNQIQSLHSLLTISLIMGLFPWIPQLLNHRWWYPLLSPKPTAKSGIGAIFGFAYNSVDERFAHPDPDKKDLIQWMIDHRTKDDGSTNLTQARIRQEALPAVLAGSDTTASTLRSMLLEIATNPRIYNKLMSQIDAADDSGLLSTPPTYDEVVHHVPYMDSIRKEALRILPAAASIFFRTCPGSTINGYTIPRGTEVGIVHWPFSRSPLYFGPDCDLFRPERWTDEPDEQRRKMRDLGDVFFSNGVFMCTGRHLAIMEVMKMPVEFFRRFELEVVNSARPWVERGSNAVLHGEFMVVLRERRRRREGEVEGVSGS